MRNFRELKIWNLGIEIAEDVYGLLPELPRFERYGVMVQMATAPSSIPANIAEGCGKSSDKDFKRYLEIALGSTYELETHLILAARVHGLETDQIVIKLQDEQRMIVSLIKKL